MAAGLGFKDFVTGEVLTAADVDGYLMQGIWVFANAAARTAAVTSPQEGNYSYLKDTNSTEYYTGSAWVAAGAAPASGLTLVSATSFSGVSNHSVNNCFTSTYLNYKILINYTSATGSGVSATMKFRASGTDTSANYKTCRISGNTSGSGVSADTDAAGTDEILIGLIETGYDNRSFIDMTVYNPQASVPTAAEMLSMGINSGNFVNMTIVGAQTASTAFDGLTIFASSGNMTGTIKIYGLQNS
jgi:hypothetical protein